MTLSSVRYSALAQDDSEPGPSSASCNEAFQFGTDPEYFKSAFTYANYNDLDNMGYLAPKRFGSTLGSRHGRFTYCRDFPMDAEDEIEVEPPLSPLETAIVVFALIVTVATMPFSLIFTLKLVGPSERLVILRLGKARRPRGPGPALVLPCVDSCHKIDTRTTAFNVPPLQIITQDRGLVEVGATVFLRVRHVTAAVCAVQDRNGSTRTLAATLLYRYVNRKRICELSNSHERRLLAATLKDELTAFTQTYGVEITDIQLSEVKIIKSGENMGMAALSAVAKSEVGQQLWSVIGPSIEEVAREAKLEQEQKEQEEVTPDLITLDQGTSSQPAQTSAPAIDLDKVIIFLNMGIDGVLTNAVGRVYQVHCDGCEPFFIDLKHGNGCAAKGVAPVSDVTFHTTPKVLADILAKRSSPIAAYMSGTLRIDGSVQDALSLSQLAQRVAHLF